jgi:hypothetical protein
LPPPNRATKIVPNDRAQLKDAPVSLRRVLSLFTGHQSDMIVVTVMTVATPLIGHHTLTTPETQRLQANDQLARVSTSRARHEW